MLASSLPSKATTLDVLAHVAALKMPEPCSHASRSSLSSSSLVSVSSKKKATTKACHHPATYLKSLYSKVCCCCSKDDGNGNANNTETYLQAKIRELSKPNNTKGMSDYTMETSRAVRQSDLLELRRLLYQEGHSFNACNKFGESLLHMACRRGDARVIQFLIHEARVNVNVIDDTGRSCLHDALWTSSPKLEVLDILIRVIAPELFLAKDIRGHTPFDYARKEHLECWTHFLQEREDLLRRRLRLSMMIG